MGTGIRSAACGIADIAIIGGGVVGCSIARELSRYELNVVLIEKEAEVGFGTSKANSGIVHAGFHSERDTLEARLCVEGNRLFDGLCGELSVPFRRNGSLLVTKTARDIAELERLRAQGIYNGVPGLEILSGQQVLDLEPGLSREVVAGLYAPTAGVVSPYELTMALAENAQANGVRFMTGCEVWGMIIEDGGNLSSNPSLNRNLGLKRLRSSRGDIIVRYVINAAGLFGDDVAALAGGERPFRIIPRKGEEYILDRRVGALVTRTIFPMPTPNSKGILVIPTADGNIMIGPTAVEVESKHDLGTTRAGFDEIFRATRDLVPSIDSRDIIASFAGLRAASDRHSFIIERSPGVRGFMNVCGIESPGLTASPAIARMVASMIGEEMALRPKRSFNPERRPAPGFREMSAAERRAAIARDPAYGRIVCRCELVSEAEVVDTIRRGARTLDGVKFRTRAGMGRCQGGFCTPRVMSILSRELGVPMERLTKRGDESFLVTRRY
ncbi:MAG: NAD(P)/FAD-dependent oxidoreductase [Firmicutes bacterium]|nr:NAD(P)/FAD-dependent oxidoreductase [Bacillota bacterium]